MSEGAPNDAPAEPPSVAVIAIAYALMLVFAWGWLYLRDRQGQIALTALGRYGVAIDLSAGAMVGLVLFGGMAAAARYLRVLRELEGELRRLLGGPAALGETAIVVVATMSAVAEEVFFRCALFDVAGMWWSALIFGLLHAGGVRRAWLWGLLAFAVGVLFGGMIHAGLGLLSVTVSHALTNYLSLRRLLT